MIYLNRLLILLLATFFAECDNHKSREIEYLNISSTLDSLFDIHGNNLAILSCTSCGCFPDSYNIQFLKNNEKPDGYILLADTTCNQFRFKVVHIKTSEVEKISDEFYNVTLIKKRGEKKMYRILSINESNKIKPVANQFFKN